MLHGSGAFVTGPPGSGVSAVLRDLAQRLREADRAVVHRVGSVPDAPRPFVVVDDAHALGDADAERARDAVLNEGARVILGTTRSDACAAPVQWLWSSGTLLRFDLRPLADTEVIALVERAVGVPPDGATARAFMADSGGLPAYLVPIVDAAIADGVLVEHTGLARLRGALPTPPALLARVRAQRAGLDPEVDGALCVVCAAGSLAVPAPGVTTDAITELHRSGLVVLVDGRPVRAKPAFGALARAVRADLGPVRLVETIRTLLPAADAEPRATAASWRVSAGESVDVEELAAAAREHRAAGDVAEAARLARLAWAAGDQGSAFLLAEVSAALGQRREAAEILDTLLREPALPSAVRAAASFEYATLLLWNLGEPDRAVALAADAIDDGVEVIGAPRAHSAYGSILLYSGRVRDALDAVAPHADAPDALPYHVRAVGLTLTGDCADAVAVALRGLDACLAAEPGPTIDDPEIHVLSVTLALGEAGRLAEAAEVARTWYERGLERGLHIGWLALARTRVALMQGDLASAEHFAREAAADFADLDNHAPRRWALAGRVLVAAARGDLATTQRLVRELDELGPSAVQFLEADVERARAWAADVEGRSDTARAMLADTGRRMEDAGLFAFAATACHDRLRLGDPSARAEVARLAPHVDSAWSAPRAAHAHALQRSDWEACLDAAHQFAAVGASLCALDAAAHAVVIARRKAGRTGLRSATAASVAFRSACPQARTPAVAGLGAAELSPRERQVATFAAQGMASREIAAVLDVSPRTVDNLLQRVYAKLGVRKRVDLAAALERD